MNLVSRIFCLLLTLAAMHAQARSDPAADMRWAATWAAAAQDYQQVPRPTASEASLDGQTLRQRLLPTLGGNRVRVRFSNQFGKVPLTILGASVARSTGADGVSPATMQRLRFGGRKGITVAPGTVVWSDAARFGVDAGQAVAVSLQLGAPAPMATVHHLPPGASSMVPGDAVLQPRWRNAQPSDWNHVVTGLDVATTSAPRVVVAFGDSITEGAGAIDVEALSARYPDRLAARLRDRPGRAGMFAVINAGIAGNRLLDEPFGPKAIERFERDVLGQSGATHVVILIGINDINLSPPERLPHLAEQISAGLQQLVDQARSKGVKVLLGTLTPFKGAPAWSAEKELQRQAVNRWIRGRQDVDAVVDFDAVLRDPADPMALNPLYDGGDHLHPGNMGYAAMAGAIDLRELQE